MRLITPWGKEPHAANHPIATLQLITPFSEKYGRGVFFNIFFLLDLEQRNFLCTNVNVLSMFPANFSFLAQLLPTVIIEW